MLESAAYYWTVELDDDADPLEEPLSAAARFLRSFSSFSSLEPVAPAERLELFSPPFPLGAEAELWRSLLVLSLPLTEPLAVPLPLTEALDPPRSVPEPELCRCSLAVPLPLIAPVVAALPLPLADALALESPPSRVAEELDWRSSTTLPLLVDPDRDPLLLDPPLSEHAAPNALNTAAASVVIRVLLVTM